MPCLGTSLNITEHTARMFLEAYRSGDESYCTACLSYHADSLEGLPDDITLAAQMLWLRVRKFNNLTFSERQQRRISNYEDPLGW